MKTCIYASIWDVSVIDALRKVFPGVVWRRGCHSDYKPSPVPGVSVDQLCYLAALPLALRERDAWLSVWDPGLCLKAFSTGPAEIESRLREVVSWGPVVIKGRLIMEGLK